MYTALQRLHKIGGDRVQNKEAGAGCAQAGRVQLDKAQVLQSPEGMDGGRGKGGKRMGID